MIGLLKAFALLLMLGALAGALLADRCCGTLPTDMTGADE